MSVVACNKMTTVRFGTTYGGFEYPRDIFTKLNMNSIVYCVGAGEDISHDVQLARLLQCEVHIFDPTPRAIQHVELVKASYESRTTLESNSRYGGGDPKYTSILSKCRVDPDKIKLYPYGFSHQSGTVNFYMPDNEEYVSCSMVQRLKGKNYIPVEMKRISDVMQQLGHSRIDLLKMDIEGSECDVLEDMLDQSILPTYLAVEFDLAASGLKEDMERCERIRNRLYAVGYTLVAKKGRDMSFVLSAKSIKNDSTAT